MADRNQHQGFFKGKKVRFLNNDKNQKPKETNNRTEAKRDEE